MIIMPLEWVLRRDKTSKNKSKKVMTCEVKEVKHEEKNLRVVGEMSTSIGKSINTLTQKFTKNIEKNDESCKAQKIKIKETTK